MARPKIPQRKFIRPLKVDVGRGPEFAVLSFKRGDSWISIPPEGDTVIWEGRERRFWNRRIAEGAAEVFDKKPEAPKADKTKADKPKPKSTEK